VPQRKRERRPIPSQRQQGGEKGARTPSDLAVKERENGDVRKEPAMPPTSPVAVKKRKKGGGTNRILFLVLGTGREGNETSKERGDADFPILVEGEEGAPRS